MCATLTVVVNAGEHHDFVRPVELIGLAGCERQRHVGRVGLPMGPAPALGVTAYRIVAAGVPLRTEQLPHPHQRQPLPPRLTEAGRQQRLELRLDGAQLRVDRRCLPVVAKRCLVAPEHLPDRVPRQTARPRDRLDALPVLEVIPPNRRNRFHYQHPPKCRRPGADRSYNTLRGSLFDADHPPQAVNMLYPRVGHRRRGLETAVGRVHGGQADSPRVDAARAVGVVVIRVGWGWQDDPAAPNRVVQECGSWDFRAGGITRPSLGAAS